MEVRHHLIYDPLKVTACTMQPTDDQWSATRRARGRGGKVEQERTYGR